MTSRPRHVQQLRSAADLYDQVKPLACEIERDERTIKEKLIHVLECGQAELALKILNEWCTTPPRVIVSKYLEDGDGNSE